MPASGTPPELYKERQPKWLRKKTWPGSREKAWWCRMCSQWATCEHIKSKRHQNKRYWIDEENWSPTSSEWSTPSEPAAALALANEAGDGVPADPAGHQDPPGPPGPPGAPAPPGLAPATGPAATVSRNLCLGSNSTWEFILMQRIEGLDQRIQALEEELRAWREWEECILPSGSS